MNKSIEISGTINSKNISTKTIKLFLSAKYKNKKVGGFGDVGVYSSSSLKTLDTYGGGLLVYDRKNLNKKMEEFKMSLKKTSRFKLFKKI